MKPMSLRWRIYLLVTLVVATIVTAISMTAYLRFRSAYLGHIDRMLTIMSKGVVTQLDVPRSAEDLAAEVRTITESPWRGPQTHFRLWVDGAPDDLAASVPASGKKARFLWDLEGVDRPDADQPVFFDLTDKKKHFRAIWVRHPTGRGTANVVIAHPSSFEHRRLDELLTTLLVVGGGLILAGATLGAWLTFLGLRPLRATASRLATITDANLGQQDLSDLAVPAELQPVVDEMARLLARLDAALNQQKQFVADASHQLRTPLSLAQSSLELAASKDREPAEYRKAVAEALDDLDRMRWLIDQLLTLARVEGAAGPEGAVDVCLDALLQELAVTYDARAAEQGGAVVCDGLSPCNVRGDEKMLTLVFGNLLDNALKYGPRGGTVRVSLEHGPADSCTACIQDDGGTIPAEALPHLFDRFYRAPAAGDGNPRGAGLGLTIAREVARRHGGDAWVTSSPAARTTFHVRLPATLRPAEPAPQD